MEWRPTGICSGIVRGVAAGAVSPPAFQYADATSPIGSVVPSTEAEYNAAKGNFPDCTATLAPSFHGSYPETLSGSSCEDWLDLVCRGGLASYAAYEDPAQETVWTINTPRPARDYFVDNPVGMWPPLSLQSSSR